MHPRVINFTQARREHRGTVEDLNFISGAVVSAGVRIHQKLGPGLLESVYFRIVLLMNFGMTTTKEGIRRIAN